MTPVFSNLISPSKSERKKPTRLVLGGEDEGVGGCHQFMGRVLVFGAGLVGGWVADTLAADGHFVTAVDTNPSALAARSPDVVALNVPATAEMVDEHAPDVVVNTLPGRIGHGIRAGLLERGCAVADLAFTAEDPGVLHDLAVQHGGRLVWDIGVAPGMSNLLLAEGVRRHGRLTRGRVRVGGNPVNTDEGWSYMAPFSPYDVIEEYTRPARIVRDGAVTTVPALAERQRFNVEGRGEMEAFLTDGLRSVLNTIPAENLTEATVRWPGHIDRFIELNGAYEEDALVQAWAWDVGRPEFTWMEVVAEGEGSTRWILDDEGRPGGSSMARTTGAITCAVVEHMLDGGVSPGVHAPEAVGHGLLERCLSTYAKHGIVLREV